MPEDFDVFLSHNSQDREAVTVVGEALKARNVRVWLDSWELRPGGRWQRALQAAIRSSRGVAVFVGSQGLGPWEEPEMEVFLDRAMREDDLPVIPVVLPGAPQDIELPAFLSLYTWVDLRGGISEEGIDRLVWGVTGVRPGEGSEAPPPSRLPQSAPLPSNAGKNGTNDAAKSRKPAVSCMVTVALAILLAVIGLAVVRTNGWFSGEPEGEATLASQGLPDLYALRVQVLDPNGEPVEGSEVRVSHGNEPQGLPDGWWEVEIPAVKLPLDRKITLRVDHKSWRGASQELTLGEDPNPSTEIKLRPPESTLRGLVLDPTGKAVAGARVTSQDVPVPSATTDADGRFELALALPPEARVRVRAEADGFPADETYCYTDRDRCILELRP